MPITQDRMLTLLQSGQDYQQALKRLCGFIREIAIDARETGDFDKALDEILALTGESVLLRQPLTSHSTLALEALHFKKEKYNNIRRRKRQQAQRDGTTEAPKRQTAPASIRAVNDVPGVSKAEERRQLQRTIKATGAPAPSAATLPFIGISADRKEVIEREAEEAARGQQWMEENQDLLARVHQPQPPTTSQSAVMPGQEEIEPDDSLDISPAAPGPSGSEAE